jgi:tyrosine phenol-lyase
MTSDETQQPHKSSADEFFMEFLNRTLLLMGEDAVQTLKTKTITVAGCGGVGAAAAITMARMGVSNFVLADPGSFDEPDINRQWGATTGTLGRNKAEVYDEVLRSINPAINVRKFCEGVTETNIGDFLNGADFLIDCLDIVVPTAIRNEMYRQARSQGIHCISAPVIGFGTIIVLAAPDGMPMEAVFGEFVSDASEKAQLPEGLGNVFVKEHLAATEKLLPKHKVPSLSISPVLATSLVCTEATLVLLGASMPGWRPPICLPQVLAVEPLTLQYRVMDIKELSESGDKESTPEKPADTGLSYRITEAGEARNERSEWLARVGYNTNLVPPDTIAAEMLTDSWHDLPRPSAPEPGKPEGGDRSKQLLQGFYDYKFFVPVFRGRFAEALLAKSVVKPGRTIATNALFPTTRYHLVSNGAKAIEIGIPEAYDISSPHPFKGNIDIEAFRALLNSEDVQAVYMELCVNALGGHPVSIENLRAVRSIASEHGVSVILDTTRVFENAEQVREREPGFGDRSMLAITREICANSDMCAASLSKDFLCRAGAFIATNSEDVFVQLRDLATLGIGSGLSETDRYNISRSLQVSPETPESSAGRMRVVRELWESLDALGVPLTRPCGGHGVFVDAAAMLPHIPAEQHPAAALSNALFVAGGIRGGVNLISPEQAKRGTSLLRLTIPVGVDYGNLVQHITDTFAEVQKDIENIDGLEKVGGPPGMIGQFAAQYKPRSK